MTTPARVVGVSISSDGLPAYKQNDNEPSPLRACTDRWAALQEQVRDLPWAQCPPEMTADFARSMARELLLNDGDNAAQRACLFTASLMAEKNIERIDLSVRCPALNSGIELTARITQASPKSQDAAVFEMEVDENASEQEIRDGLAAFASKPSQGQFFDPIGQTPDAQVAQLVACAERIMGDSSFDILVLAATALLTWNHMEKTNSATLRLELGGLHNGEGDVLPEGSSVVFEANTKSLDFVSDMKPLASAPTAQASIRLPRR